MLVYGFAKVFLVQFQTPTLTSLVQEVGQMSPMGLAWTFMGFNPVYSIFTGLLEIFAGLFLIFRPTKTFGALMTVGVMTHVAVMNLCFDIPVKIFSIHLVVMGLILLIADKQRFMAAFFNKNLHNIPTEYHALHSSSVFNKIVKIKGVITILIILIASALGIVIQHQFSKEQNKKDAFYGIYEVIDFKRKALENDSINLEQDWNYVIIERVEKANIKIRNSVHAYHFIINLEAENATIYKRTSDSIPPNFSINQVKDGHYNLKGVIHQDSLHFSIKSLDLKKFPLISRGFKWVNETPYNR
jgi:hypothetical protein